MEVKSYLWGILGNSCLAMHRAIFNNCFKDLESIFPTNINTFRTRWSEVLAEREGVQAKDYC